MLRRYREKKRLAEAARKRAALEEEAADLLRKAEANAELANLLSDPASMWNESTSNLPIIPKRGEYNDTYDDFMLQLRDDIKDLRSRSNELRNQALAVGPESAS